LHLGFSASKCDLSLFSKIPLVIYLLAYADDIIIADNSVNLVQQFTVKLILIFSSNNLGSWTTFWDGSFLLTQSKYIRDLLQKTKMAEAQPIASLMVSGCKLSKTRADLLSDPTLYRLVVGALQYSTITKPELSFTVNKVLKLTGQQ